MKSKIVSAARQALAEACWRSYRETANALAMLNPRDPDGKDDIAKRADLIKKAAADARKLGKDPVAAADAMQMKLAAQADKEHYGREDSSSNPKLKTTRASIEQGDGDFDQYKREKAEKDPKPKKKKKSPSRRKALGRGGGKYRRKRIQPARGHHGPSAPTQQVSVAGDAEGEQKRNFQQGTQTAGLSRQQVNRMGVRGQEKKIADKKKKGARKALAQRFSNKIRAKRGLVPLLPGEKHGKHDKLGDTEN